MLLELETRPKKTSGHNQYPDSEGRDSSQMRRLEPSTTAPLILLEAPETTSAVIGDFHEPYGAVISLLNEEVEEDAINLLSLVAFRRLVMQ